MATKVQLINGNFQDSEGNVLNLGYLTFELNQDEQVSGVGQICAGTTVKITLDANGNVAGTQSIWGNDVMAPANSYYTVRGYNANGQLAWGPNVQQVTGGPTFDLDSWVPNSLPNFSPAITSPTLQTNGVNNGSQSKLNLKNGSNVTITDDGVGDVTIAATSPVVIGTNRLYHQALVNGTSAGWNAVWQLWTAGSTFGNNQGLTQPTATTPLLQHSDSNIGVTQPAYVRETNKEITLGILNSWLAKCAITPLNNSPVFWAGMTDNPPNSALGVWDTLTPAANFVGFRLFHPETTYKCICQTDATHQTVVDSGIAADTNLHKFSLTSNSSGTSVTFYIDGTAVATISTNVPVNTTQLATLIFAYEDTGALPNITLSFNTFYWDTVA